MALDDVISQYWWIFLIFGIVIIFLIWRKLDTHTQMQLAKIFNKKVLLVLAFAGIWYYWHQTGGTATIHVSTFWMPVFFLLFLVGSNYIGKLRYKSQQLIAPNFHGSYSYVQYINGYYVFAIDGFISDVFNWNWASRLVILREETVQFFDQGAVSIARVGQVIVSDIDEPLKSAIDDDPYFKTGRKAVFYGWFDDLKLLDWKFSQLKSLQESKSNKENPFNLLKKELDIDNPKVSTLFWLYKNQNRAVNNQTEWFKSTIDTSERGQEHRERMRKQYAPLKDETQKSEGSEGDY